MEVLLLKTDLESIAMLTALELSCISDGLATITMLRNAVIA
jgi:hypothetical protein